MQSITLFYIVLSILIGVAVAFFQYFFKVKNAPKTNIILFVLKTFSVFLLLLLLINPKIVTKKTENIKPIISVLLDNSVSTQFFKEDALVKDLAAQIKGDKALLKKFDINFFSFGKDVEVLDSLTFNEQQTDIAKSIKSVNDLYKKDLGAIVLVSDGNQTIGSDYEFINSKQKVFPLVIGDTVQYKDLKIAQLNVNKYSYLKNKFPVEAMIVYEGKDEVSSVFTIRKKGKTLFSKTISLSPENNSTIITTNLTSDKEGIQYYSASISRLENEKNTKNNSKNFSVEVIDEQTKVLVLSSVLHPDLGAYRKAIESNQQRKVELFQIRQFKGNLKDYQLVIFYQPNRYFKEVLSERSSNYIIVTGTKTDWNFINGLNLGITKAAISQYENYGAIYNSNFLTFLQKDIGFNTFPPLKDKFGDVTIRDNETLLYQKITGITTEQPLLSTFEKGDSKYAVLLGEGIWKWRAASYVSNQTFEEFDTFFGNIVQFLASNKKRKRLDVSIKTMYLANETITVSALYLDNNYKFDNRASLEIAVENVDTKEKKVFPFSLVSNSYQVNIEGLTAGDYVYRITVDGQKASKSGRFKILDYQIEEQFTSANTKKLNQLALKTKGALYYKTQVDDLIRNLTEDKTYYTRQKSITKEDDLIQWQWILILLSVLLAVEWFLRKYYGKI